MHQVVRDVLHSRVHPGPACARVVDLGRSEDGCPVCFLLHLEYSGLSCGESYHVTSCHSPRQKTALVNVHGVLFLILEVALAQYPSRRRASLSCVSWADQSGG
jgi:hypothetical protein